jgi:aminopeptidase N
MTDTGTNPEDVVRSALSLLDGRAYDPGEAHEAWLDGGVALEQLIAERDERSEVIDAMKRLADQLANERDERDRAVADKAIRIRDLIEERDRYREALEAIDATHRKRYYCLWAQDIARTALHQEEGE